MLGYLPGLIHAWYIIAKYPEYDYEPIPDNESQPQGGRVTYYYISQESRPKPQQRSQQQGYGTQGSSQPAPPVPQNNRPVPASNASGPSTGAGGAEAGAPPSYADAVKGDHKVQRQE